MATNRRLVDDSGPDFYPTPVWGTQALLDHVTFNGSILEPCCGDGAMSKVLNDFGYHVVSSDLYDRGYGAVRDFLSIQEPCDNIITNPPFNVAEPLLLHALSIAREKVAFLLRTAFVEGGRRYRSIFAERPPKTMLVFSERLSMYPKGHKKDKGGTTCYSWFIWDNTDPTAKTRVEWIPPGLKPRSPTLASMGL